MAGYIFIFFIFLAGAAAGSFLNVCIYRVPVGKSIVSPPSSCPSCGRLIRWYDNVPIFGWFFLKGKCRYCKSEISVRYPAVELLTALLTVALYFRFGISFTFISMLILTFSLIVITFIDIDHQIIPDVISLPGIVTGFCSSFFVPWLSWKSSLTGILLGGGILLVVAYGYYFLTKKEGMGGGDIKLLAMMGAFLGWKSILFILFASSLVGSVTGITLMKIKKADSGLAIPFGPYLAFGALLYIFFGKTIIFWYLGLFS